MHTCSALGGVMTGGRGREIDCAGSMQYMSADNKPLIPWSSVVMDLSWSSSPFMMSTMRRLWSSTALSLSLRRLRSSRSVDTSCRCGEREVAMSI